MKTNNKTTFRPLTDSELKTQFEIFHNVATDELNFLTSDDNRDNKGNLIKFKFERSVKQEDDTFRQVETREWRMLKSHVSHMLISKMSLEGETLLNSVAEFRNYFLDKLVANALTGKIYTYFNQKDKLNLAIKAILTKLKTSSVTIELEGIKHTIPKFDDRKNACYINKADNTSHKPNLLNWSNVTEKVLEGGI